MISHSKPFITQLDTSRVNEQLLSGNIAKGQTVKEFENKLSQYLNAFYTKFVDSGSKGIKIALQALGIKEGDEVILPTYLCHQVIDAVISVGALPVLCDVSGGWNVSTRDVERVITRKTKAIILVHTMGIAIQNAMSFRQFNVPIIEDCCQSFGAKDSAGIQAGTIGDLAVYSFHAIKCLTTGEGGLITTALEAYAEKINKLCSIKANAAVVTDLQAALGLSQLSQYPLMLQKREKIAAYYFSNIINSELTRNFKKESSIYYRFLMTTNANFNDCKNFFESTGIAVRKGVDELLHQTYSQYATKKYPNAERIFNSTVSIPIYPALEEKQMMEITAAINAYEKFR